MFNELYKKVVEKQLFNFFSEHNFSAYDIERIIAEVNKNKKLHGSYDLAQIFADVYSQKLAEQAPAPAAPAPAAPAPAAPAAGAKPPAGQQPATPAKPDPKAQQQQNQAKAAATRLVQDIDVKWKDFTKLLQQAKTQVQSLFMGK